ncbi:MAG: FG-GAP repeat domain-containing protein [Pirellulales bacterium]
MTTRLTIALAATLLLAGLAAWFVLQRSHSDPNDKTVPHPVPSVGEQPSPSDLLGKRPPYQGPVWFVDVTSETGVVFHHHSGDSPEKPFPSANGSGLGAVDYDMDGLYDLYFVTGTDFPIDRATSAYHNRFFRNRGKWNFEDVTDQCGLDYNGYSHGVAVGDYDNDGFPDIYVTCYGANRLFHNLGDGTYRRVEVTAGVADERWAGSAAFFDYDRDGYLDLYVCNYAEWTLEKSLFCGDRARGVRVYCSPGSVEPVRDVCIITKGTARSEW